MDLTLEQIKSAARGAVRVEEKDGLIELHRFTRQQQAAYALRDKNHHLRTFATANVQLEFETDSAFLELAVHVTRGSSRLFFGHSVFVNGTKIGELAGSLTDGKPEDFSQRFDLGGGRKRVRILFPWSVISRIRRLALADGAAFAPVAKIRKMLIFGDSITQGYDAVHPENAYAVQLAEYFDADAVNKAIGGEIFWPELASMKDPIDPDIISVAYGTNDWSKTKQDVLEENSRLFYRALRAAYPNARILVLAPIWRADNARENCACPFGQVTEHLKTIAGEIGGTFIDCIDFVPWDRSMFSDKYLHPDDGGFLHYGSNLKKLLTEIL